MNRRNTVGTRHALLLTLATLTFSLIHLPAQVHAQAGTGNVWRVSDFEANTEWAADEPLPTPALLDNPFVPGVGSRVVTVSSSEAAPIVGVLTASSRTQPQEVVPTRTSFQPSVPVPASTLERSLSLFGTTSFSQSEMGREMFSRLQAPSTDVIFGVESKSRVTTDVGNLLGKSPGSLNTAAQRRTPIVTEPRVRGSRIGQLAASGSHWIPARIDLDTAVSKIDSRLIDSMVVIGGPYSVQHGPGLDFIDVQLLRSPRYEDGFECHGSTGFDFHTNGEQWGGLQRLWGGDADWGFHASYGHRTGNDFTSGSGLDVASSYNSRDVFFTFGKDLSDSRSVEVTGLRVDQTGVEFPGYVFDMDYLVTDSVELEYIVKDQPLYDRLTVETWYNNTRFHGNAQNPSKRQQFPVLDYLYYDGYTDVAALSAGYTLATTWGVEGDPQLTVGTDLRFINQYLDEIGDGLLGFLVIQDANSPLPESESVNPGIFAETTFPLSDRWDLISGVRTDWTHTDVTEDPANLTHLGFNPVFLQSSLTDILGTDQYDQNFATWAAYLNSRYELTDHWALLAGAGHSERPPSLTELYVAESFLLLLQNGLNSATGDPLLAPEQKWQLDLGLACHYDRFRGRINAYHAWIHDYITFENMGVFRGPLGGQVEQEWLKFVNTDWAVLTGCELSVEYQATSWLTPFATMRYVEGRDLTRDGDFATQRATPGSPSTQVFGLPRGFFSGIAGSSEEPLPGIVPVESRLGIRIQESAEQPRWGTELSVRVVDGQDRVATSLLEMPTSGFAVWDVRGYWRPSDRWLLVAGVENFGDRNYREHLDFRNQSGIGVYQPGVNFYVGSELNY